MAAFQRFSRHRRMRDGPGGTAFALHRGFYKPTSAGRMSRHIAMKNAPPVMRSNEKAIQNAEGDGWYRKEIHRSNGFTMIAHKRRPPDFWLRVSGCFPHPAQHSSLRKIEAEHFHLSRLSS